MNKVLVSLAAGLVALLGSLPAAAQEPQINGRTAVTVLGCIERETSYRSRTGNPGAGAATEIVLSGAHPSAAPANRLDYSVTGKLEPQMLTQVGAQAEIVGFVEDGTPHELPGQPVVLPRLFVTSWQITGGLCTAHP